MEFISLIADGRTDFVIDFINQGGDTRYADNNVVTLLHWCAYYGDVTAIKCLLQHGEKRETLENNFDLNGACFYGLWQLVQFLIEHSADVNLPLKETGETCLHFCIKNNHPFGNYILRLLLHHGANPNVNTIPGKESSSFMHDSYTKGETPLHRAAAFGNEEGIQLLIEAGAKTDAKDIKGESPIGWVSWHGRPGKILKLLQYGTQLIHTNHVNRMQKDQGYCWNAWKGINLLGKIHLKNE